MKVVPDDTDTPEDVRLCIFLEIVQTAMLTVQPSIKQNARILVLDWHCRHQHWNFHMRYSRVRCLFPRRGTISPVQRIPNFIEQNIEESVAAASHRVLCVLLHLRQELNPFMIHIIYTKSVANIIVAHGA